MVNSAVEVAVTESTVSPGNDDSVTPVEVVTALFAAPADDHSVTDAISTYCPRGTACGGNKYFRFSYRAGTKVWHIHIRGGNTDSPIAQAKVQEVRSALESGCRRRKLPLCFGIAAQLRHH